MTQHGRPFANCVLKGNTCSWNSGSVPSRSMTGSPAGPRTGSTSLGSAMASFPPSSPSPSRGSPCLCGISLTVGRRGRFRGRSRRPLSPSRWPLPGLCHGMIIFCSQAACFPPPAHGPSLTARAIVFLGVWWFGPWLALNCCESIRSRFLWMSYFLIWTPLDLSLLRTRRRRASSRLFFDSCGVSRGG